MEKKNGKEALRTMHYVHFGDTTLNPQPTSNSTSNSSFILLFMKPIKRNLSLKRLYGSSEVMNTSAR